METVIENGKTSAIVLQEDRSTVKKMWDNIVDLKVKSNQLFIKGAPVLLVVASVFAAQAAIPLLAVAAFLESKTGKKMLDTMMKSEKITGELWKGNVKNVNEELDSMLKQDVDIEQVKKDISVLK